VEKNGKVPAVGTGLANQHREISSLIQYLAVPKAKRRKITLASDDEVEEEGEGEEAEDEDDADGDEEDAPAMKGALKVKQPVAVSDEDSEDELAEVEDYDDDE
jgi:hypothetical protein